MARKKSRLEWLVSALSKIIIQLWPTLILENIVMCLIIFISQMTVKETTFFFESQLFRHTSFDVLLRLEHENTVDLSIIINYR